MVVTRRSIIAGISGSGLKWLLRDDFTDTLAAGSLIGTPATPGPGTRAGVDTGNTMSTSGGKLLTERTANYNPVLGLDAVTREAGRMVVAHVNLSNGSNRFQIGWSHTVGQVIAKEYYKSVGVDLRANSSTTFGSVGAAADYYFSIVLKTTGAYYFMKKITSTPIWKLMWMSFTDSTATLYPVIGVANAWGAGNNEHTLLRVPEDLWLPTPLLYETFTDDNGTSLDAHGSDVVGPDSQAVGSLTGVEQSGDWDIQSNRANSDGPGIHTWDVGKADIFADLVINGGAAGNPGLVFRFTDTGNYWYLQADRANNQLEIHEVNATVDTVRANVASTINDSTDYTLRVICEGQTVWGYKNGGSAKVLYGSAALNEGATKHGLFSDNAACEFDDLLILARN